MREKSYEIGESMMRSFSHRVFRVSLAGLFVLMTCVAGFFAGFYYGQIEKSRQHYLKTMVEVDYQIADLVDSSEQKPHETVAALVELITSTISHDQWKLNGGENTIEGYPTKEIPLPWSAPTLCVSATGAVHDEISELLSQLRRFSGEIDIDDIVPPLQTIISSQDASRCQIIRAYQKNHRNSQRMSQQFASAVETLSNLWGKPEFSGSCTDKNFPQWSAAQSIATWPRNGGIAFVEVREMQVGIETQQKDCQCIAVGWQPNEKHEDLVVKYIWEGPKPK